VEQLTDEIWHWTAFRESIAQEVSSYWIEPAGIVIDPMVPPDVGLGWFEGRDVQPQQVVLTSGLHWRDSDRFAEQFGIPVRAPWPARERYQRQGVDRKFDKYEWNDEVAPGVTAVEIDKLAPDEGALHIAHGDGAVAIADALIRAQGGAPLAFVPDSLMGAHPQRVKDGLRDALRGLLVRDWDALLLAHGDPIVRHGQAALRDFLEKPVGYPEWGQTA
jgi:hypothetical protein